MTDSVNEMKSSDNLTKQIAVLQAANRMARLLAKTKNVDETIENLMEEFLELVKAEEGSIQLLRVTSQKTRRTLVRRARADKNLLKGRFDDLMTGWVLKHKRILMTSDIVETFNLDASVQTYSDTASILAVPLSLKEQNIGVVNLVRSGEHPVFDEQDQTLVTALCSEIAEFIEEAQVREQLFVENELLREKLQGQSGGQTIIGNSASMKEVFAVLDRVIPTDGRVLVQGESGTGKEVIAKYIHASGPRKQKSFVAIDCGALPANLLESELFGYVRGAFTGANKDRKGLFEEANGGTLFLDEVANMTLETQAKLLRVLQEEEIRPLGANQTRKVNVRVIAAASQDLKQRIEERTFRSDLFYRLNIIPLYLPALRERVEDIPVLADHFLQRFSQKHNKPLRSIAPEAIETLEKYRWPGNVRELENVIERAVIFARDDETNLTIAHLPRDLSHDIADKTRFEVPLSGDLTDLIEGYEREILGKVLNHHNWNQTAAARALNISERVIRYKIKNLELKKA